MSDDPRLAMLAAWMHEPVSAVAQTLAELDAVDPLRQLASRGRVEAACSAFYPNGHWESLSLKDRSAARADMNRALAAADHVPASAEKPDFPPWSREMWILLHYLAQKCQGQHPAERETMSHLLDQARRAAFPETQDERS